MAEKTAHDAVNQVQSVRDPSPTDVSATQTIATPAHVASEKPLQASQTPSTATDNATTTKSDRNGSSVVGSSRAESGEIESGAESAQGKLAGGSVLTVQDDTKSADLSEELAKGSQVNGVYSEQQATDPEAVEDGMSRSNGAEDNATAEDMEGVLKELGENQEQTRPNALKKSTTFKPVSVTKNFLAKAGTPTAPVAKPAAAANNAGSGSSSSLARPRLVAKSASGQRASTPKSSNFGNKTDKDGPDPNQVWNRNRGV